MASIGTALAPGSVPGTNSEGTGTITSTRFSPTATLPAFNNSTGNTNDGGSGGGNPLGTSASLYLYTFLATLVLLLSVSAAIVIRSFMLRRRHRLMVEEAIRNGTWVPPIPASRTPRVDLSKKPVLWEAYLTTHPSHPATITATQSTQSLNEKATNSHGIGHKWREENPLDWESIKPISTMYGDYHQGFEKPVSSSPSPSSSAGPVIAPIPIPTPSEIRLTSSLNNASNPPPAVTGYRRLLRMLNPTPDPTSPLPAGPPQLTRSAAASSSSLQMAEMRTGRNDGSGSEQGGQQPTMVRVAVLIAMPSPPSYSSSSSSKSFSPSPSDMHLPPSSLPHTSSPPMNDEPQLPYLEMGVAEVALSTPVEGNTHPGRRSSFRKSVGSRDSEESDHVDFGSSADSHAR